MQDNMTRTSAPVFPPGGAPLARHVRAIAWLVRRTYFHRVRVLGTAAPQGIARLVICSHRNGALDGYIALAAFPQTQFLTSVQLLKHPLLRWLFDGIAVVRSKDVARYGAWRSQFGDPVEAACAQLRAGGDLLFFPEGSSEWGHRPLPYHRGAARTARQLLAEGVRFKVIPVGLHYPAPDRFRSDVDVLLAPAVALPARAPDEDDRHWELRLHTVMMAALDAVSVNCPDADGFAQARAHAAARALDGEPYALAFLDVQRQLQAGAVLSAPPALPLPARYPWDVLAVFVFALLAAPVLLVGALLGRKADASNTVSLFRCIGGLLAAPLWLAALLAACIAWPLVMLPALAVAALGWWRWPRVLHRSQA